MKESERKRLKRLRPETEEKREKRGEWIHSQVKPQEEERREEGETPLISQQEVEELIEGARYRAGNLQGRSPATSQDWAARVQGKVAEHLAALQPSFRVAQLGDLLSDVLEIVEECPEVCRSRPTVGSRSMFPLPTSGIIEEGQPPNPFLRALTQGLNSLHGLVAPNGHHGSKTSRTAVKRMADQLDGCPLLQGEVPDVGFGDFFRHKGIDY